MERDRRLTGSLRGQSVSVKCPLYAFLPLYRYVSLSRDFARAIEPVSSCITPPVIWTAITYQQTEPIAPKDFSTNSIWQTERVG
jgi:hypothetical protein